MNKHTQIVSTQLNIIEKLLKGPLFLNEFGYSNNGSVSQLIHRHMIFRYFFRYRNSGHKIKHNSQIYRTIIFLKSDWQKAKNIMMEKFGVNNSYIRKIEQGFKRFEK